MRPITFLQVKSELNQALTHRITKGEQLKQASLSKRLSVYWSSGFGLDGYQRTVNFLKALDEIDTLSALFELIQKPAYQSGFNMPKIIRSTLLKTYGVNDTHINYQGKIYLQAHTNRTKYEKVLDPYGRIAAEETLYQALLENHAAFPELLQSITNAYAAQNTVQSQSRNFTAFRQR